MGREGLLTEFGRCKSKIVRNHIPHQINSVYNTDYRISNVKQQQNQPTTTDYATKLELQVMVIDLL